MRDHGMATSFAVDCFELLSLNASLIRFHRVDCFECSIGQLEDGAPDSVTCLGPHRWQRAFPFSVGQREDQFRLREVSDELELGVGCNGTQALGRYERRIREVQGAQGGPPRLISFGEYIVVIPTRFPASGNNRTPVLC